MKSVFINLVILTTLLGCSKETPKNTENSKPQEQHSSQSASPLIPTNPSEITLVEMPERQEWLKIGAEAAGLLAAKDFGKLEELANNYRTSKECIASGIWKLEAVYFGIIPVLII